MAMRYLQRLLEAERVLVLGEPVDAASRQLLTNAGGGPPLARYAYGTAAPGFEPVYEAWPEVDVALVLDPRQASAAVLARLARANAACAVVPCVPSIELPSVPGLRLLGPCSAGVAACARGLNLTALPLLPGRGKVALIGQSASVIAAVADWAAGRRLGFTWIVSSGHEADVDAAELLDFAALDHATEAVVLQLSHVRRARAFMSAARACARAKPVVVLQTGVHGGTRAEDASVRSAAFRRAGIVECDTLAGLFDALEALERLPPMRTPEVIAAGTGAGVAQIAQDALVRRGLKAVELGRDARERLRAIEPGVAFFDHAVDLGSAGPQKLAGALRELVDNAEAHPVLFVRSPAAGASHLEVARGLDSAQRMRGLLTVWLGLGSVIQAREHSSIQGYATFTTPDDAARALMYRWQYARSQELLLRTPSANDLPEAQAARVRAELECAERAGGELAGAGLVALLDAYGLAVRDAPGVFACLGVHAFAHAELGMVLRLRPQIAGFQTATTYLLPPLDNLLAQDGLEAVGLRFSARATAVREALVQALIRIGELVARQPALADLRLRLAATASEGAWVQPPSSARLGPPLAQGQRLALSPYPLDRSHWAQARDGRRYLVRPVRAWDEAALLDLFRAAPMEDIRLRFFAMIRDFTHLMAARMTQVDYDRELTLVALPSEAPGRLLGIATLVAEADRSDSEFAVIVAHDVAGQGVASHLLGSLVDWARDSGVRRVHGDVLAENTRMRALAQRLGFHASLNPHDGASVRVTLDLAG